MSEESPLMVYSEGPIRHIRFNRPDRLNAIDLEQHERVMKAVRNADGDPSVRVLVFSGAGRAFCSGDDLRGSHVFPKRYRLRLGKSIEMGPLMLHEATTVIRNVRKPTVALIHGYAYGAGYDYALSCDFRVATEDCQIGDPRVHRALSCTGGWAYRLTRLVPAAYATRITLLGQPLTGLEAEHIGLVHRTYPPGVDLREAARDFLLRLASLNTETYATIKRHILDSRDLPYEAALAYQP